MMAITTSSSINVNATARERTASELIIRLAGAFMVLSVWFHQKVADRMFIDNVSSRILLDLISDQFSSPLAAIVIQASSLSVASFSENRFEETLALTPALSPRRGRSTLSFRDFHAHWCGIAHGNLRRLVRLTAAPLSSNSLARRLSRRHRPAQKLLLEPLRRLSVARVEIQCRLKDRLQRRLHQRQHDKVNRRGGDAQANRRAAPAEEAQDDQRDGRDTEQKENQPETEIADQLFAPGFLEQLC